MKSRNIKLTVIAVIGYTYAKWSVMSEQTGLNTFKTSCLDTTINEQEAIKLKSAYPITDAEGLLSSPYEFTLTNECDNEERIEINLELFATTSSFLASQMRYSFNDSTPDYVSNLEPINPILNNATSGYLLLTDTLPANTTHKYALKLWIDENLGVDEASNKAFKTKISIITTFGK